MSALDGVPGILKLSSFPSVSCLVTVIPSSLSSSSPIHSSASFSLPLIPSSVFFLSVILFLILFCSLYFLLVKNFWLLTVCPLSYWVLWSSLWSLLWASLPTQDRPEPWDQLAPGPARQQTNGTFRIPWIPHPTVLETVPPPQPHQLSELWALSQVDCLSPLPSLLLGFLSSLVWNRLLCCLILSKLSPVFSCTW